MARNKRPVQAKPVAESSEEEEQNNSDQQTDSDSSDSANLNTDGNSKPTSSSESETDSDSDRPSNFTIKPIDSKQHPPTPPNKTSSKRPAESEAELGLGELKKIKVENDNIKKPSLAHRLFSEDDEIALLEGMVAFQAKKGIDAYSDIPKFHEFIKKSIHFDATPNQLKEKIRRLRNKYISNVKKSVVISKSHDFKVFNLSKKLWGSTSVNDEPTEKKSDGNDGRGITLALASKGQEAVLAKKQKKVTNDGGTKRKESGSEGDDAEEYRMVDEKGDGEEDYSVKYPLCVGGLMEVEGLSDKSRAFWVHNLGLIGKAKLEQYEAKLEKIKWAELELFIQKKELINEKLKLLLQSSKSSR